MLISEITGGALFWLLGIVIGLTGSGGGVLSIPILFYCFNKSLAAATTYSFIITGCSSALGALRYRSQIEYKKALCIAPVSMIAVLLSRRYILEAIPEYIVGMTKQELLLYGLSVFMLICSYLMLRSVPYKQGRKDNLMTLALTGAILGILMGMLGISGGFIMVPVFMIYARMPIKNAIATSLFIVTMNATSVVISQSSKITHNDYWIIATLTALNMCGMLIGTLLINKISSNKIKKLVGYIIMIVACGNVLYGISGI